MEIWVTGMNGVLWDLGFGIEWTKHGYMGPGWDNMGLRDEWGPMGCGIWGRVALKCRYGAQGRMGSYGMWDLGSGGPIQRWTYGVRDEDGDGWDPMGCGIWGRVALKWRYGAQGWMGPYGI